MVKLHGEGATKRRIMDMGITKGVEIHVRKVAPLGDPMELNVRGYELSVRKADAEKIEVFKEGTASPFTAPADLRSASTIPLTSDVGHWCVRPRDARVGDFRQVHALPKMIHFVLSPLAKEPGKPEVSWPPFPDDAGTVEKKRGGCWPFFRDKVSLN